MSEGASDRALFRGLPHQRATIADREVFLAAYRLDREGHPRVRHLVASDRRTATWIDGFLG